MLERQLDDKQEIISSLLKTITILSENKSNGAHTNEKDGFSNAKDKKKDDKTRQIPQSQAKVSLHSNKDTNGITKPPPPSANPAANTPKRNDAGASTNKRKVYLVGDRMLGGVNERDLSAQCEHTVKVKSHGGANSLDLIDHTNAHIRKCPDSFIFMGGTNDCGVTSKVDTIKNFETMIHKIRKDLPKATIAFTEVVIRKDKVGIEKEVADLNNRLRTMCQHNQCDFIETKHINHTHLGEKKLHLKPHGSGVLAKTFISYLNKV